MPTLHTSDYYDLWTKWRRYIHKHTKTLNIRMILASAHIPVFLSSGCLAVLRDTPDNCWMTTLFSPRQWYIVFFLIFFFLRHLSQKRGLVTRYRLCANWCDLARVLVRSTHIPDFGCWRQPPAGYRRSCDCFDIDVFDCLFAFGWYIASVDGLFYIFFFFTFSFG